MPEMVQLQVHKLMTPENKPKIDRIDRNIVECLRENARFSMREIGERVHLSGQAVANRIAALEDAGVLKRFTINVDCPEFGYPVHILLRFKASPENRTTVIQKARGDSVHANHHLLRCYRISGSYEYLLDMVFTGMEPLNAFLEEIDSLCEKQFETVIRERHAVCN